MNLIFSLLTLKCYSMLSHSAKYFFTTQYKSVLCKLNDLHSEDLCLTWKVQFGIFFGYFSLLWKNILYCKYFNEYVSCVLGICFSKFQCSKRFYVFCSCDIAV